MTAPEQSLLFLHRLGAVVERVIADHEARLHVPPAEREPLTAIPFPQIHLTDTQVACAWEWLTAPDGEAIDVRTAALRLGCPVPVLERHLADYAQRWRRFLARRAAG